MLCCSFLKILNPNHVKYEKYFTFLLYIKFLYIKNINKMYKIDPVKNPVKETKYSKCYICKFCTY